MNDVPSPDTNLIFHIAFASDWNEAKRSGSYRVSTRGASLDDVGFIHAGFKHQVARVGSVLYRDTDAPLVVLVIDTDLLGAPIVVENLEGGDEGFPHIYGPVPTNAVVGLRQARVTPDGGFSVDELGGA